MDNTPEHIWLLIARKLSGEATTEELQELEQQLRQHPDAGYPKEVFHDLWQSPVQQDRQYSENRYKELVQQIRNMGIDEGRFTQDDHFINNGQEEETPVKSSKRRWIVALVSAAAVFLIAGMHLLFAKRRKFFSRNSGGPTKKPDQHKKRFQNKFGIA